MKQAIRTLPLIVCIIATLLSESSYAATDSGVSRELARQRKACVSDVVYNLSINIDSTQCANPDGLIEITFDYRPDNQPLQFDFTGKEVKKLTVNHLTIAAPEWSDGHIIIDPRHLISGSNSIIVEFESATRALNRNPDYMYTLFVPNRAHSVFPCFDQPDIKARYNLTLTLPDRWKAVSNSPVTSSEQDTTLHLRTIKFDTTEPLSTYLFAFAAGEFDYQQHTRNGRTIGAYYRENDPDRLAQLDEIFSQVESSLEHLESYTGIQYPFAKYDLVILPGFQFGGMEHTGATFYNDNTIFLNKNATGAEKLSRAKLIAHETAHMWFGDYVTMEWFDDVWTKEVFANFFAARLTRALLPEFDHDLEWLRVYMTASLDQDRSNGSTPIRQELDNLKNAGLIYNNIIYNKSPIMMDKLAEITGEDNFKLGIRKYLSEHAYGNATWDDLIAALAAYCHADIKRFSKVWVYEAGMPNIEFKVTDGKIIARQTDPRGRGIVWPQTFDIVISDGKRSEIHTMSFDGSADLVELDTHITSDSLMIIPTADGRAYGLLTIENEQLRHIMVDALTPDGIVPNLRPVGRLATLMMLNENYLYGNITTYEWLDFLIGSISRTTDSQMLSALTQYMAPALIDLPVNEAAKYEQQLFDIADSHPLKQGRTLILKKLITAAHSPNSMARLYEMWKNGESPLLSKDDFSDMALQLAVAMPCNADSIIAEQRSRIEKGDRLRKFDYISRAAVSDTLALDALFESLHDPANRLVEPWTLSVLSLLNHPSRHNRSVRYIIPALELLPEIQATGDIFFPANWSATLLGSYRSTEAAAKVNHFMNKNQNINPLLLNKVRQGASRLMQKQR